MERIDKIISNQTGYSRKDVKELIKQRRVIIDGEFITKSDIKIEPLEHSIMIDNQILEFKKYVYLVLNKPKGYVSATYDNNDKTVLDLVPEEYKHRNLFPAGRLDKDTTGLMIITDDGKFAHEILSPNKHVKKEYNVTIDIPINDDMIKGFRDGVMLNDGECKTSLLDKTGNYTGIVTLTEGRYHQIKRMFGCFGAKVLELERIKMGSFELPSDLELGKTRELTEEELNKIQE